MKNYFLIACLLILCACNPPSPSDTIEDENYPDTMSLWKVIDDSDEELFYFFPNDSCILQYKLDRHIYYPNQANVAEELSGIYVNNFYLKEGEDFISFNTYSKNKCQIEIDLNDSLLKMDISEPLGNYNGLFTLKQFINFEELPNDPRKMWIDDYNEAVHDTLVRYTFITDKRYIIYSKRGVDIDSLQIVPYEGKPHDRIPRETDTFFVHQESGRIFEMENYYAFGSTFIAAGPLELSRKNEIDSLAKLKLLQMVYPDSIF
ncbi:MAG: hypothetical protein GQ574_13795 [Crocinitomix sp.]|nr:hypothetical protein [Crocinitomix sp.]